MKALTAYTFFRTPAPGVVPEFVVSEFVAHDGQLEHYTEGRLRAVVPPEGFDRYEQEWPACKPVVDELRAAPVQVQTVFTGADALAKQKEVDDKAALERLGQLG